MCRVQLHCPSTSKTLDNFVIGAYQKPEQVLQGVRLALDLKFAALYTVDAKPISDPSKTLQDDERVLVATSATEIMLPDAAYGYAMYAGEEGEDVDIDVEGYGMDWQVRKPPVTFLFSDRVVLPFLLCFLLFFVLLFW